MKLITLDNLKIISEKIKDKQTAKQIISITSSNCNIDLANPNTIYVASSGVTGFAINRFNTTDSLIDEYEFVFHTSSSNMTFYLPDYVCWANGEIPNIEADVMYELNIRRSNDKFMAVLIGFKTI